jgi:rod shape determining protein RodA
MIDRRLLQYFDWWTLLIIIVISLIGILTIYSATRPLPGMERELFYQKQLYWLGLSLLCVFVFMFFDYTWLKNYGYIIFTTGVILLVVVIFIGRTGMGAQRWLSIGFVSFQPSEFFKLFFIIALARYFSSLDIVENKQMQFDFLDVLKPAGLFLFVPMILIMKQPDLGTALMLLFIFAFMVLTAGVKRKVLMLSMAVALISLPFVTHIFWGGLKGYQKNRIIAFIDPHVDPKGIGYQLNQSKISIGSGGFTGKGYLNSTQGPLRFLPERHTDFIFSIFGEEWGFLGALFLFSLYLIVFLRALDTAFRARDMFGTFLATGVTAMMFFYFTTNIGMTLGIMPVVGVPMPFMSYGGTALLSNYMAVAILINVRTRRFPLI